MGGQRSERANCGSADRPSLHRMSDASRRSPHDDDLRRSCHSVRSQEILREGAANGIGLKNRETEIGRKGEEGRGRGTRFGNSFSLLSHSLALRMWRTHSMDALLMYRWACLRSSSAIRKSTGIKMRRLEDMGMLSKYARHPLLAGNPDPLPVSYLPHIFKHRPSTHGAAPSRSPSWGNR